MTEKFGSLGLNLKYDGFHNSDEVNLSVKRLIDRSELRGTPMSQKEQNKLNSDKLAKTETYIARLQELFHRKDSKGSAAAMKMARKLFVIKENEIPEAVFELEKKMALERGYGVVEISQESRKIKTKEIIESQESSLNSWIEYLTGPDAMYDDHFKYVVFRSITKMGGYNKEKGEFEKRSKTSTRSFPEINGEALGAVEQQLKQNPKLPFDKLYAKALQQLDQIRRSSVENKERIEGSWTKFDQGSDYKLLESSLKGYSTGWCTATGSARSQIAKGDFYVYYSKDKDNDDKIPRIAIRMEGLEIGEIRGVNQAQELEPEVMEIMEKKASTLNGYDKFKKKSSDMKKLTNLYSRDKAGEIFGEEDSKFLYQEIEGFGSSKDPRINELQKSQDIKVRDAKIEQLAEKYGYDKSEVGDSQTVEDSSSLQIYFGDLYDENSNSNEIKLPKRMEGGELILNGIKILGDLKLPNGYNSLNLARLKSTEGLLIEKRIEGYLYLSNITSAKGLKLPEYVGGEIDLSSLETADGLLLPRNFDLSKLGVPDEAMSQIIANPDLYYQKN
jgi:hypothetical protein